MRKFFFSIKRVLSTFRRTTAIAAGIALTLVCWIAFDQPPGTKIWDFYTGKAIQSSAAIGHNGMVYFGTDGGKVYAFYPDGRGQWEFPTGDRIVASPAVGSDGTIYIGGYDGILYAIAPEGIERWRFRANGPISSSAAIGPDGTICFGTLNNRLFALRPDGSKIWDLAASEPVVGSPAIGANGILYAPSSDGVLAAIRLATGDVLWEFEAPNRILSSPAIAADGTLYFGCFDGHLYALDRYGKKKWTFATGGPIRGSASVGPDGTVYVGSDDRQLYALAPDGFKKWTFTAGKWIRATPAIAADGTVYIGSYDHSLYAVSPTGAKKWEYVTDHNVTASAAISRDGTVFFGSWNGRFYAIRGGAALAEGEWPRFRGDSQQRGSVGRITPPAPLIAETRTPEAEAEVPQTITITQEPGSVLGRWWSRLRSSSTKASTQTASAVAEARVIEANTSTTVVAAAEPALPTPNPGTMTPVWKQNDRESLAVDPSTVLDTAAAEPVRAITIRQEQGSVLGRWWRGLSKKKESPEPGSASAMATSSEPDATSVTTTLVTAAGTNDLDAEREAAYRARTTAMESRISTLESELATKRQNEAKVIADSDNLISGAETVVTTTTVTAPTSVRTRSVNLHRELVNESTTATQTARPGMLPMMRLISVDPPSKAELKKPETPRLQHPSEIPPESPAPKLENQMDLRSRLNVLPGEVDLNGEQEIAAAWGESPDEAPRQSSWWSRVFGSSEKAPKQEVAESPAPVAPTSIQSNGREAAYENRIISLEQHIAELNARLAQQQSDNATAPTTLTFAGPTKQVTSETGLSVNVAPVVSETVTAQPEIVTAREREYRAGLFQRMFSKNEAPVRSVAVEETTATINAGEVVESSAVRVISDSATLVSPETTTETTKVTRVVEAEPVQPEVVTAKEREYRAGLFQRMFSKNEAPVRSVAVQETTATINAGEVVESSAVRVISDSATLVSPETTTETTKVTRVVEAEPIQPEVVTAKEREYRAGLFQRMFSKNEAPVRSIAVQETTATINAGEVVESSAVRVISDSATLVSPETTTETTKVTRVVEAEPIQPEVVTAKEREYRAGLFQRMFSKNEAPVRSIAVEETTATINTGEVVESSAVRVISDSATLVSPETTAETTKVTRVVEAEPIQPEVVTAKEREYRAGLFQRMFSMNEAPVRSVAVEETTATINAGEVVESSAVRVISDSATLVSPETTTETTKVTRVVEAEPVQPEVVTAKEREYRAGLFQRMFSKNEAPVRSVAVEETTATINAGEVVESSAVRVISDSATLVSLETTTETTKVTRVVEAEPVQPEVVTAKEREYRAGLFQRMFSKNEAPVRSVAVEETTATINAGEVVESSAVRVISDSATLVSPETTTETTKVTRVVEAEPVQPEVVTAKERENRPGFFKRLFSGKDGDSAVRVVSVSRTSETSPEDSGAATVENLSSKDSYSETPATVEPKVTPPKPSGPFDAKLAKLEGLMGDMQEELEATRQERDELKRQIGGSLAESIVAVPAPTSKATTAERKLDPDSAAEADYGDKISKLESQLVSLSEELGNARVERARMREELATARRAPAVRPTVVDSVPVSPVLPETTTVIADSANLVTGDGAEIPQPEWLKREVRSVIATADPWTQPPGTAAATIAVAPTELAASESTVTESKISGAVDLVELPAAEETTRVEEKVIRRKPGFFGRLFGLGESVEERRYASTNVVVTPPAVNVSAVATSQPSDSQLLGNDTGFGSGAAQTNFPRVAYSPEAGTSFFTPGAGNLTQLPGFPRPQPALIAPPAREMDPTRISSGEGLKSVAVRESVPVVPVSEAGVTTVGSLSVDRPVVAIMSPPDGSELAGRVLDLRGLAQGERRIAQVLVSLDGGPFTPAAGLERWSFQSPVPTGQVLVRVKAMDATGRESEIVSRTYGHTANARLNVEVIGNGTVSPDLNARELQIGTPYEIVARPAPGNEFVGWSGGVTGSNPKLVFQMNSGLFLRAEFRPIGRELSLRGSYTGLLYPGELMQADRSGYFELNIERDGTFGGEIRLATSAAPLRGRFDTSGQATQTIERPGAAPITIRFMLQNEGAEVVGTFDADGVGIVMRGFRSVPDGDTLAAITPGRYTLVIPGPPDAADSGTPAGDGFGEVQIDAGGHVKFTGELPDGTVVKQETRISSGGVWPVYVPLYGGAGMLTGWISVTNHPSLDLHGDLRWIKPPTPSDRYYPGGFAARRFVFGSIYKPSHDNLDKRKGLAGVLLGGNLGRVVLGQDVATMPLTSPQRETLQQFKYQVDQNSGRVEGSFLHPETKQPTAFRGVLVQKRGWKSGYFMGADASGVVYLNGQ